MSATTPGPSARITTSSRAGPRHAGTASWADLGSGSILEQIWWRLDRALDLEMLEWSRQARRARSARERHHVHHRPSISPNAIEGSLDVIERAPRWGAIGCMA